MIRLEKLHPAAFAIPIACLPLFPGFITLTNVAFPGVSVVPERLAIAVIASMAVLAIVFTAGILRRPFVWAPTQRTLAIWMGACLLAFAFGFDHRDGAVFAAIACVAVIWHAYLYRYYPVPRAAAALWWAFVASGTLASAAAIGMDLLRRPPDLYRIANGRAVGTFVLPGELAGYLLFFIPIAYALAVTARTRALRIVATIGCACGVIAMALSFSRTGWVGLAAAVAFLVAMRAPRGAAIRAAAVLGAGLVLVLALFNEHHNPSENFTRLSIWQAAIGIVDRFPLTGVGPFGFSKLYPLVRLPDGDATAFHAHSLYLTFFAETGIVGLGTFVWMLVTFWRALGRRVRELDARSALLPLAIAAGVAGSLVQGLIDTVSVVIFGLLIPMLALALAAAQFPGFEP